MWVALSLTTSAQNQEEYVRATQYAKKFWQLEEGLPQNSVNALAQTDDGYLWVGTEEGLARFNGVRFEIFDGLSESIFENGHSIRALLADGESLWIGTDGTGLIYYSEGKFSLVQNALLEENAQVNSLYKTSYGDIIVGTDSNGLFQMRADEDLKAVYFFEDGSIRGISEDKSGNIYIGTDSGLFRFGKERQVTAFGPDEIRDHEISSLYYDSRGRVWISTREGTMVFDDSYTLKEISPSRALTFVEDQYGDVWIGLDGNGLLRYSDDKIESINSEHGLTHDKIVALLEDREGSIWVGTEGGGLGQLRRTPFLTYGLPEGMISEMVLTVIAGENGTVWAGTEGGGVYHIDPAATDPVQLVPGTSNEIITSLAQVSSDLLMIGTYFGGLWQLNGDKLERAPFNDRIPEGSIAAMVATDGGTLWLGTDGGVVEVRQNGAFVDIINSEDGLGSDYITSIHEDRRGRLWIGTYDAGLYLMEDGVVSHIDEELDDTILCIQEDADGNIWLSTLRNGLFVFNGEDWFGLDRKNGLPTTTIYQLVFDDMDGIWMTSNKGLMRASRSQALEAAAESRVTEVRIYGRDDGLRTFEFNGGVQPAGAIDSNGRIWLPSIRGLAEFSPASVLSHHEPPEIILESVTADGKRLDVYAPSTSRIELQPGRERVEIAIAAMTLKAGKQSRIEYMLYDFEERWNEVESGGSITYTNLVPGDYILRIRSVIDSPAGVVYSKEKHVVLVLKPRFYQYTIFWVFIAFATAFVIILAHRIRVRHVRKIEQARREQLEGIVEQRTEELRNLNDQLEERVQRQVQFILSVREKYEQELVDAHSRARESERLKSTILRNLSHEFRTPITSIIGFAEIIEEKLDEEDREFVKYIKESASRLSETLLVIVDMSDLESRAVNIHDSHVTLAQVVSQMMTSYSKQISDKGLETIIDVDPRLSAITDAELLAKVLSILTNNALKFTETGHVAIRASQKGDSVTITVEDTGIGIREDFLPELFSAFSQESSGHDRKFQGVGLGLTVASQLVTLLQGSVSVKSVVGEGSSFSITLPKKPSKITGQDREAISHLSQRYSTDSLKSGTEN